MKILPIIVFSTFLFTVRAIAPPTEPTAEPTPEPSRTTSQYPSAQPTSFPSSQPSAEPTSQQSYSSSFSSPSLGTRESTEPSLPPITNKLSPNPSIISNRKPSIVSSLTPSNNSAYNPPTKISNPLGLAPTIAPSHASVAIPSVNPLIKGSVAPTLTPATNSPTLYPTSGHSSRLSITPTNATTKNSTQKPTTTPTYVNSFTTSPAVYIVVSLSPLSVPSAAPTKSPLLLPSTRSSMPISESPSIFSPMMSISPVVSNSPSSSPNFSPLKSLFPTNLPWLDHSSSPSISKPPLLPSTYTFDAIPSAMPSLVSEQATTLPTTTSTTSAPIPSLTVSPSLQPAGSILQLQTYFPTIQTPSSIPSVSGLISSNLPTPSLTSRTTFGPTLNPTILPTDISIAFTFVPSMNTQSSRPVIAAKSFFNVYQYVQNLNVTSANTPTGFAVLNAGIASAIDVATTDVQIDSIALDQRFMTMSDSPTPPSLLTPYSVITTIAGSILVYILKSHRSLQSGANLVYTVYFYPSQSNFSLLAEKIQSAVESGTMSTSIQSAAVANHFPAMQTVSVSTAPKVSNPFTFSPTATPIASAARSSFTMYTIVLGVSLGFALLLIVVVVYTIYQYQKTRLDNETFKEWTERKKSWGSQPQLQFVVSPSHKLCSAKISYRDVHGQVFSPRYSGKNPMSSAMMVTSKGRIWDEQLQFDDWECNLEPESDSELCFDQNTSVKVDYKDIHFQRYNAEDFQFDLADFDTMRRYKMSGGTGLIRLSGHSTSNSTSQIESDEVLKKVADDMKTIRLSTQAIRDERVKLRASRLQAQIAVPGFISISPSNLIQNGVE